MHASFDDRKPDPLYWHEKSASARCVTAFAYSVLNTMKLVMFIVFVGSGVFLE